MTKNLMDSLEKQYEIYEIKDDTYEKICNDALESIVVDDSISPEYQEYWQCKLYLDNYIMNEIQKGNDEYKLILSITNSYIVKRYITLKKINIEVMDTKYKGIEQFKRLERYYEKISEIIAENLSQDYDYNSPLYKQYVKQLNKKFK